LQQHKVPSNKEDHKEQAIQGALSKHYHDPEGTADKQD
jgi:hypothetical protein